MRAYVRVCDGAVTLSSCAGLRGPPPVELLCLLINSLRKIGLLTEINFHSDRDYVAATA